MLIVYLSTGVTDPQHHGAPPQVRHGHQVFLGGFGVVLGLIGVFSIWDGAFSHRAGEGWFLRVVKVFKVICG